MKHIIVANMNVPLYSWPLIFRKVVRQQIWGEVAVLIHIPSQILSEFNSEEITKIGPCFRRFAIWRRGVW